MSGYFGLSPSIFFHLSSLGPDLGPGFWLVGPGLWALASGPWQPRNCVALKGTRLKEVLGGA